MEKRAKVFKKYFKKRTGKINQEVHHVIQEDYRKVYDRAQALIGESESVLGNPITVIVPDAFYQNGKVQYRVDLIDEKGEQKKFVYNQALVTVIYLGAERLYYYQVNIDHTTGRLAYDKAGELALVDIIHVGTEFKYDSVTKPRISQLNLVLTALDGTVIPLALRRHHLYNGYAFDHQLTEQEVKVLELIKKAIR